MKTLVGVYESNDKALEALQELKKSGYPAGKLSLISKANLVDKHIHVKTGSAIEASEVSLGVVAGSVLGVLTGIGVFAIPGLGFMFGAGALVGALAGVDFGLIGGGLVAIFTAIGIDEMNAVKYEKHLNEGKFLIFADGDDTQLEQAKKILHTQGLALELGYN